MKLSIVQWINNFVNMDDDNILYVLYSLRGHHDKGNNAKKRRVVCSVAILITEWIKLTYFITLIQKLCKCNIVIKQHFK